MMVRCFRIRGVVFGLAVLIVSHSFLEWRAPAYSQGVSEEAKAALKERDRLWDQAQKLRAAGKSAEAIAAAEAMLAIERKVLSADHEDLVVSLNWLAKLHAAREEFAAEQAARQEALEILRKRYGESHWKVTDARLALQDVERRAGMTPDQRQKLAEAERLNREVFARYQAGRYGEALSSARRALALRHELLGGRHPDYAVSLNNLAALLEAQGDYAAAKPRYEQALAIRKAVQGERHPDYATSLHNLALLLKSQGDYAAARPRYEQALALRREILGEHHADYAQSLNDLATLLHRQGDHAAARPLYEKALALRKEILGEHHADYAQSLNNLAVLLHEQGDCAAARPLCEQALAIRKEVLGERHPLYALSLNNLAELLKEQGDYAAAKPHYERALAITKAVQGERHPDYATGLNNLAALLEERGDYAAARPLYEQALAIRKEVQGERHPDYATSLSNLARLLREQGDYAAARPLSEQALALRREILGEHHPDCATSLSDLALLHWVQRNYAAAVPLLERALEIARRNVDLAAAAQSERQQLAMAQQLRGNFDAYLSLAPLAQIAPASVYRHALAAKGAVFERQRRLRVQRRRLRVDPQSEAARRFAEYQETTTRLASLALATPDPEQAQAWKDQIAARSRRKDELEAELARLDAGFRAERAEAARTPEQLRAALPRRTALVDVLAYMAYQPPPSGQGEFQSELRLVAFVVRPDRPIARVDLGPIAAIARAFAGWRPSLIGRGVAPTASESAQAVRRLIWEPVEPLLEDVTSVLISPDGPIGLIPLAALPGKEPGSYLIEERSLAVVPVPRMLGSTAPVTPVPNQGSGPGPAVPAPSLLLVGDIDYGGDPGRGEAEAVAVSWSAAVSTRAGLLPDFRRLPATGHEIAAIARYFRRRFPGAEELELDRDQATEEALRREAPRHRYLHLATHGYFAPASLRSALGPDDKKAARAGVDVLGGAGVAGYHPGLLSGIALAGANRRPAPVGQDDGILTALEVAELDLSAVELAILSACETGLGEASGGEGLLGLQRAFQVAGSRSVVASLWQIGDEPTQALMARFYENLWREGRPPGEALREAQLDMLRQGRRLLSEGGQRGLEPLEKGQAGGRADRLPPFYWAGFVLSGDRP